MKKFTTLMVAVMLMVGFSTMAAVAGTLDPTTLDDNCSTCETEMARIARGCEDQREGSSFNYESFGGFGSLTDVTRCDDGSYCSGDKGEQHKAIVALCTCLDNWAGGIQEDDTLNVSMEIVVKKTDGIIYTYTGDDVDEIGVYWANKIESFGVEWEATKEEQCAKNWCEPGEGEGYLESFDDVEMVNPARLVSRGGLQGGRWGDIDSRAKDLLSEGSFVYGWFDIPDMIVAQDGVDRRDWEVWVKICLTNTRVYGCDPCCCLIPIGILCCEDYVMRTSAIYPYFTQMNSATWWFGLAITNYGDEAGTAAITLYEQDGDIATGEVDIAAHGIVVLSIADLMTELVLSTGGTLGDSACYVEVVGDGFPVTGMGMMAKPSTGESMGYVPIAGMESKSSMPSFE
jgi:hypothetical protein